MAEDTLKITEEQLARLNGLSTSLKATISYLGELHYQKLILNQEIVAAEGTLNQINEERLQISEEIQQQFGSTGTVNLETGEFVKD
jgi:hypothetical protein